MQFWYANAVRVLFYAEGGPRSLNDLRYSDSENSDKGTYGGVLAVASVV